MKKFKILKNLNGICTQMSNIGILKTKNYICKREEIYSEVQRL